MPSSYRQRWGQADAFRYKGLVEKRYWLVQLYKFDQGSYISEFEIVDKLATEVRRSRVAKRGARNGHRSVRSKWQKKPKTSPSYIFPWDGQKNVAWWGVRCSPLEPDTSRREFQRVIITHGRCDENRLTHQPTQRLYLHLTLARTLQRYSLRGLSLRAYLGESQCPCKNNHFTSGGYHSKL